MSLLILLVENESEKEGKANIPSLDSIILEKIISLIEWLIKIKDEFIKMFISQNVLRSVLYNGFIEMKRYDLRNNLLKLMLNCFNPSKLKNDYHQEIFIYIYTLFFDELLEVTLKKPEHSRNIFLYMSLLIDNNKIFIYNANLNHKESIRRIVSVLKDDNIIDMTVPER